MASKIFYGTVNGNLKDHHKVYLECMENSTSISNNTSNITVKLKLYSDGGGQSWKSNVPYSISINGTSYTGTFDLDTRGASQTDTLVTISNKTIHHDSDGTKSIKVSASFSTGLSGITSCSVSDTWVLSTIPRASSISSLTSSITVNGANAVAVAISRKSSSFTHTVKFAFGGKSRSFTDVATSQSYVIPVSWLEEMTTATSGTGTVSVTTYNGSTKVGDVVTKNFTIKSPSYSPVIESFTVTPTYSPSTPSSWGWVANRTKAKVAVTASSLYGATIKSYKIAGTGLEVSSSTGTSAVLTEGTASYTVTVTDSRGRTATKKQTIKVLPYNPPSITKASITRPSNNEVVRIVLAFTCADFPDNVATGKLEYKEKTSTTWEEYGAVTNGVPVTLNLDMDKSFNIRFTVKDKFLETVMTKNLSTALVTMDLKNGGTGIGFGKVAELDNALDSNWRFIARKGIFQLDNAGTLFPMIHYNGINLWIGANETDGQHHTGNATMISTGNNSDLYASKLINGKRENHKIIDAENYGDYSTFNGVVSSGTNVHVGNNIRLGNSNKTVTLHAYWTDNATHDIVSKTASNTVNFGCPSQVSNKFDTTTILRGTTVRIYAHSSYNGGTSGVFLGSSGSTAVTSDENLKTDINPILGTKYEQFFDNLVPVTYKYKGNNHHRLHLGYGARATEQALLKAGLTTEDFGGIVIERDVTLDYNYEENAEDTSRHFDKLYSLRYEEFVSLNTMMIKRQQQRIDELEKLTKDLQEELCKIHQLINK